MDPEQTGADMSHPMPALIAGPPAQRDALQDAWRALNAGQICIIARDMTYVRLGLPQDRGYTDTMYAIPGGVGHGVRDAMELLGQVLTIAGAVLISFLIALRAIA